MPTLTQKNLFLRIVLMCLALLYIRDVRGQSPSVFRVFQTGGPVAYRPSPKSPWKKIDGTNPYPILYASYELELTNQSFLIVEPVGRTPIIIRGRSGVVQVGKLVQAAYQSVNDEVTAVLGTYFHKLWRNLTYHHETVDSYAQGYMKQKGVVSRGCSIPLMLTPDYGAAVVSDTSLVFVWKRDPSAQRYTLALYDNYDAKANTLYSTETTDTTLVFTLDKPSIEKETSYYWSVFPVDTPNCARYMFRLAKSDTFRNLEKKMATLETYLQGSIALPDFVKATLYEENHFYAEAYRAYFQAHRLSPTNPLFRDGFALFLARRGLIDQAKTLLALSH